MSDLQKFFNQYSSSEGKAIYKNLSYAAIYEELLPKYRNKDTSLLEIGIGYGGCLQMWKEYLGHQAKIYGIEKEERLKYEEERIQIFIGPQGDRDFLRKTLAQMPMLDIVIDDGSHISSDQIASFEEIFPRVNNGGIYICEDIHTSYRELYGGEYKKPGTFVEYCKDLIDILHYTEDKRIEMMDVFKGMSAVYFHHSMAIIRK